MKKKIIIGGMVFILMSFWIVSAIKYESWVQEWEVTDNIIKYNWASTSWEKNKITWKIEYKGNTIGWERKGGKYFKYTTSTTELEQNWSDIRYKVPTGVFKKEWGKIVYETPNSTLEIENWKIKYISWTVTRVINWDKFEYITPTSK